MEEKGEKNMKKVLETEHMTKKYKDFKALSNLNMHIEEGSIYGLIGKNGAGKTTLIRVICGLQKPDEGGYRLFGIENDNRDITLERKRIGAIIETPSLYQELTARDNLLLQYKLVGMPSNDGIDELLELVGLENTGKKKVKNFSLGMRQRLGIAVSLANNPDFLILDEPINGLDPQGIVEVRELILKLNREKRITILISSHYLDELSKIATHYGFMDGGTLIKEISAQELEKKIQKKIELKVQEAKTFIDYFEKKGFSYEIIDEKTIDIYGKLNITTILRELAKASLDVEEIHEKEESLENYFLNLIEGGSHE